MSKKKYIYKTYRVDYCVIVSRLIRMIKKVDVTTCYEYSQLEISGGSWRWRYCCRARASWSRSNRRNVSLSSLFLVRLSLSENGISDVCSFINEERRLSQELDQQSIALREQYIFSDTTRAEAVALHCANLTRIAGNGHRTRVVTPESPPRESLRSALFCKIM